MGKAEVIHKLLNFGVEATDNGMKGEGERPYLVVQLYLNILIAEKEKLCRAVYFPFLPSQLIERLKNLSKQDFSSLPN